MEGFKQFEEPEIGTELENKEITEPIELLKPLAQEEAKMFANELGVEETTEDVNESGGILSKLAPRAKKFLQVITVASAFSGAFGIGFKSSEAEAGGYQGGRQEFATRREIEEDAYYKERERISRQQAQRDASEIREAARSRARADAEFERNPDEIAGRAFEREQARIGAKEAQRRRYVLERAGRNAARQQAALARDPLARLVVGILNIPNRVISPIIDRAFDGK